MALAILLGPFSLTVYAHVRYYVHMHTHIISTTQARKEIFSLTEKVQKGSVHYLLTEKGQSKAVLMSAQEYDSWRETLEVQSEIPSLRTRLIRAEKDVAAGRVKELSYLQDSYGVQSTHHQRSRKRSR
jgi:prevent-host-death family protein